MSEDITTYSIRDEKAINSMSFLWINCYGGEHIEHLSDGVGCIKCGNTLKFFGDGKEAYFLNLEKGINAFAAHQFNPLFAYAENFPSSDVFIRTYPSFEIVTNIRGDPEMLGYSMLKFSSSNFLAGICGIPKDELKIWSVPDGVVIYSCKVAHSSNYIFAFNPTNSKQFALYSEKDLIIWTIKESVSKSNVVMPKTKTSEKTLLEEYLNLHSYSTNSFVQSLLNLPRSCVVNLMGEDLQEFENYMESSSKIISSAMYWSPEGLLYVGCQNGEIYSVNAEKDEVCSLTFEESSPEESANSENALKQIRCMVVYKKLLAVGDDEGILRIYELIGTERYKFFDKVSVNQAISSLCLVANQGKLYIGTEKGGMFCIYLNNVKKIIEFFFHENSPIISLGVFPISPPVYVTLKASGLLTLWGMDGSVLSNLQLNQEVTVMSASNLVSMAVVGTTIGFVYLGVFANLGSPRWLPALKIHGKQVTAIKFFKGGKYFAVGYEDGHVFIVNGLPSQSFQTVGYVGVGGPVKMLSTFDHDKKYSLGILYEQGSQQYVTFSSFDKDTLWKKQAYLMNRRYQFKKDLTNKVTCIVANPAVDLAVVGLDRVILLHGDSTIKCYVISNYGDLKKSTSPSLASDVEIIHYEEEVELSSLSPKQSEHMFRKATGALSENMKSRRASLFVQKKQVMKEKRESLVLTSFAFPDAKEEDYMSELILDKVIGQHKLPGSCLGLSFDEKWLYSCGQDGFLKIFDLENNEILWGILCADFWNKGLKNMVMSIGSHCIACSGYDNFFCCVELSTFRSESNSSAISVEAKPSYLRALRNEQSAEHTEFGRLVVEQPLAIKESMDMDFFNKEKIISDIKRAIQNNEVYIPSLPKPNSSMLWSEAKKYEVLEYEENLCSNFKGLLRSKITQLRKELKVMMKENEEMAGVEKIPLWEFDLDLEEQKHVLINCENEVQKLRDEKDQENKSKKHLTDLIKKECWDDMFVKGRAIKTFLSETLVHNYPMKERTAEEVRELEIVSAHRRVEIAEQQLRSKCGENLFPFKKSKHSTKSDDDFEKEDTVPNRRSLGVLTGNLGHLVGGDTDLLYNQFELCTKFQKIKQIVLVKDAIHRMQLAFNKEFDTLLALKEKNILSIKEKNTRIRKIMKDINLDETVVDPELTSHERPELLFITSDDEVKVVKFLTPEEWKKQEEEKKLEEERKLRQKVDNWRERGLEKMMGGVLEVKKEDELKKDIPVPLFMLEKAEEKWTEEEKTAANEYRAQRKNLEEEREKFKKFQEVELKKLQAFVYDTMHEFDAKVNQLISKKILVQSAIYQEELMIYRLRHSILLEEQLNLYENQLLIQLQNVKEKSNKKMISLMQAKKHLDDCQSVYEMHQEEDKLHEKLFKKEFHEVPHNLYEALFKQYKKRPKKTKQKQGEDTPSNLEKLMPSLSMSNEECALFMLDFMAELDNIKNMPEGLNPIVWDQLCHYRHEKIIKELIVRNEASQILMLQNHVSTLQLKAEKAKQSIDDVFSTINRLHSSRHLFYRNLEIQLLLKQGQVEVEIVDFLPVYTSSLLIHRDVVEELNKTIKSLGESKISMMIESRDFKKEIAQLEWEHKKMEMELQDLKNKMKDIANFKVTKEVLFFLNKDNYDELKSQEVLTLEKTMNLTKEYHKKNLESKQKKQDSVQQSIRNIQEKNKQMIEELKKLNANILERKHIQEVAVDRSGLAKAEREKRHNNIVKKSRLSELAKRQVQEIKTLKEEIGSLRTKTFPFLSQS